MKQRFYHQSYVGRPYAYAFAALVAGAFSCTALLLVWLVVRIISESIRVSDWVETPATIERVESNVSSGAKRGSTARTNASYTYEFAGRNYTGHRVGVFDMSDNFGPFQHNAYRELKQHQESGTQFRCFVNPQDPSEAILYPELRWGQLLFFSIFAVPFSYVSYLMLTGCWRCAPWQNAATVKPRKA